MTANYTTRKLIIEQGTGDNPAAWGSVLNANALAVIDYALDGWTSLDPTGGVTLTTLNGSTSTTLNQGGARALKLITATTTATTSLPAREAWYFIWNATTVAQTIGCAGGGSTVSIAAGEIVSVMCDATNVKRLTLSTMSTALDMGGHKITGGTDPTNPQDFATKAYADALAFTANAGILPGQTGNSGKYLGTNGTTASWSQPSTSSLSDIATYTATATGLAVAFAIAL